jgi:hypothetical protein
VLYSLLNVGLLLLAIILMRRTYAVFGVIGISIYLSPTWYSRTRCCFPSHYRATWLAAHLPEAVLRLRPARAR